MGERQSLEAHRPTALAAGAALQRPQSPARSRGKAATGRARAACRAAFLGSPWSRTIFFAVISLASLAIAAGYVALARQRHYGVTPSSALVASVGDPATLAALRKRPHVLFISTAVGVTYGRITLAPLDAPAGPRVGTNLTCDRVYAVAGQGLCLGQNVVGGIIPAFGVYKFDGDLQPTHLLYPGGVPSRVRLSPDGRIGAMTVFVSGHSYAQAGFSTQTTFIDMGSGATLSDLEQFAVSLDGTPFQPADRNFWGVTFARDGNRFYATLGTGGTTYLVEGDVRTRQARVLHEGVECPSLSPDNTRLAFKKRVPGRDLPEWHLALLALGTLVETPLVAEGRSVDDQVEWLDDDHILYAIANDDRPPVTSATNIWILPVDGSEPPRIFVPQAYSPAVVR